MSEGGWDAESRRSGSEAWGPHLPFLRFLGVFANDTCPVIRFADQCFVTFFDTVNGWLERALESGWTPVITPATTLIVLETIGRRSGRRRRFPVFGTMIEEHVVVRSFRGTRSQWARNLRVRPDTRYWRDGTPRRARALVFVPGFEVPSTEALPFTVRCVAAALLPTLYFGWAFIILVPIASTRQPRAPR